MTDKMTKLLLELVKFASQQFGRPNSGRNDEHLSLIRLVIHLNSLKCYLNVASKLPQSYGSRNRSRKVTKIGKPNGDVLKVAGNLFV